MTQDYAEAHEQLSLLGTKLAASKESVPDSSVSSVSSYYAYCKELAADPQVAYPPFAFQRECKCPAQVFHPE